MIFKKDNFIFGAILGFVGPILGVIIFKLTKFQTFSFRETMHFMLVEELTAEMLETEKRFYSPFISTVIKIKLPRAFLRLPVCTACWCCVLKHFHDFLLFV